MSEPVSSRKASLRSKRESKERSQARASSFHHVVYVVYLRNPKGDGKAGYYVGMTGLTPEERFANHKAGIKASSVASRFLDRGSSPPTRVCTDGLSTPTGKGNRGGLQ